MIETLLALALAVSITGLATWYGPPAQQPGDTMCNGEPFHLDGATVAVDRSLAHLVGRWAVVRSECGKLAVVEITDTGMLADAGRVRFGVGPLDVARYWPADRTDVKWADGAVTFSFVADFPQRFFAHRVACGVDGWGYGETTVVNVWILPR